MTEETARENKRILNNMRDSLIRDRGFFKD